MSHSLLNIYGPFLFYYFEGNEYIENRSHSHVTFWWHISYDALARLQDAKLEELSVYLTRDLVFGTRIQNFYFVRCSVKLIWVMCEMAVSKMIKFLCVMKLWWTSHDKAWTLTPSHLFSTSYLPLSPPTGSKTPKPDPLPHPSTHSHPSTCSLTPPPALSSLHQSSPPAPLLFSSLPLWAQPTVSSTDSSTFPTVCPNLTMVHTHSLNAHIHTRRHTHTDTHTQLERQVLSNDVLGV